MIQANVPRPSPVSVTRRGMIVISVTAIAVVVLLVAAGFGGCYYLALHALHNHNNLSVTQSCTHWDWVYSATAHDGTPALHGAVGRTLGQLGCAK